MINTTFFANKMRELEDAFDYDIPERRLRVYYEQLKGEFTDIAFSDAVATLIQTRYKFPSIADFFDYKNKKMNDIWSKIP